MTARKKKESATRPKKARSTSAKKKAAGQKKKSTASPKKKSKTSTTNKKKVAKTAKKKTTAKKKAKRARPKEGSNQTSSTSALIAVQSRLEGKRFYLDARSMRTQLSNLITQQGGTVGKSVTAKTDYVYTARPDETLVAEVRRLNETEGASIEILDRSELADVMTPDRDTLIDMLKAGGEFIGHWNLLAQLRAPERPRQPFTGQRMDVSGADFRGCDLTGANFRFANIDRCNFQNATLDGVKIGEVARAKFDRAVIRPRQLGPAQDVRSAAARCTAMSNRLS